LPELLTLTPAGLYCAAGDFYIDPWRAVPRAVLTHAHADHARSGSSQYYALPESLGLLRQRLGASTPLEAINVGERRAFNAVEISLHPAGHILGSAQVRISDGHHVTVCTGDFKRDPDPSCAPFELVPCDTLITEATFALPIYRWPDPKRVAHEIFLWWQQNAARKRQSVLCCYSLGKAQRILAELRNFTDQTVYVHTSMSVLIERYREQGIAMVPTCTVRAEATGVSEAAADLAPVAAPTKTRRPRRAPAHASVPAGSLLLLPPGASQAQWLRDLGEHSLAFASGWMAVRGARRRHAYDRGFVLSDHADWDALVRTARESGARDVYATHGSTDYFVRYLNELGIRAHTLRTEFGGDAHHE
jgi:putative mRNA 3-end processing factor